MRHDGHCPECGSDNWDFQNNDEALCRDCGAEWVDSTCPTCGADIGPSSDYPWHLEDEDCRAVRDPIDE